MNHPSLKSALDALRLTFADTATATPPAGSAVPSVTVRIEQPREEPRNKNGVTVFVLTTTLHVSADVLTVLGKDWRFDIGHDSWIVFERPLLVHGEWVCVCERVAREHGNERRAG